MKTLSTFGALMCFKLEGEDDLGFTSPNPLLLKEGTSCLFLSFFAIERN